MSKIIDFPTTATEHVDVLIVGAGLSGIGTACHFKQRCPDKTVAIFEARERLGGTWDLFRYPGIRSDSDMFTLGYNFKPWTDDRVLADGPSIRDYVAAAAREHGIDGQIRFNHRIVRAAWSSSDARWTVEAERTDTGETLTITCNFFMGCTGYYRYDEGFTPEFEGVADFAGEVVHPQHWPEQLDYADKRVVVIGSGATAITLVPAMAKKAAHVTMLQRSPTYIMSVPSRDPIAKLARRVLPAKTAYAAMRWKNVGLQALMFNASRRLPSIIRSLIRRLAIAQLPSDYDVDTHFNPRYQPWDQRLCVVPNGDLFRSIRKGRASIVTGEIERFTEDGLQLRTGDRIVADIVITATGLNLLIAGGIEFTVDGEAVDFSKTVGYKGMMFSGIPNFALTIGYTNASWTLKCDLVAEYVCRMLAHMDAHGFSTCVPKAPPTGGTESFIDLQAGYVLRSLDQLPKQGDRSPWRLHQNYVRDIALLRRGAIQDEGIEFFRPMRSDSGRPSVATAAPTSEAATGQAVTTLR